MWPCSTTKENERKRRKTQKEKKGKTKHKLPSTTTVQLQPGHCCPVTVPSTLPSSLWVWKVHFSSMAWRWRCCSGSLIETTACEVRMGEGHFEGAGGSSWFGKAPHEFLGLCRARKEWLQLCVRRALLEAHVPCFICSPLQDACRNRIDHS